jgi:hypothetical protein
VSDRAPRTTLKELTRLSAEDAADSVRVDISMERWPG